jgi:hypothetical protein
MRLSLQPNEQPLYGQKPTSHLVTLPHSEKAVLEETSPGSWRLTIYREGIKVDRGLFGSTHDILTLLEAEYFPTESRRE